MISVCIPLYNFDVKLLVTELSRQAGRLDAETEIILIDDASDEAFKKSNRPLSGKVSYIELEENIGRARIRNLFLEHARKKYLLFLDCDSLIPSGTFLSDYLDCIRERQPRVLCGGRIYDTKVPPRSRRLRWKYGIRMESKPASCRKQHPNRSFMTNNFVIEKELLDSIRFDERILSYGHEDTLFGYQLKKKNIPVHHIDNPVLNGHLETNAEYLAKTEEAVRNLARIMQYFNHDPELVEDVTLLRSYYKLKRFRMFWLIRTLFRINKGWIRYLLKKGVANMTLFGFYKLGYLIDITGSLNVQGGPGSSPG